MNCECVQGIGGGIVTACKVHAFYAETHANLQVRELTDQRDQLEKLYLGTPSRVEFDALQGDFKAAVEILKKRDERLEESNRLVGELKACLVLRRRDEPRHSQEWHDCPECRLFAEMREPLKQEQGPQFYCERCHYRGPVEYPHQRFEGIETEFCLERAKPVGEKRIEPSPTFQGCGCTTTVMCRQHQKGE